MYTANKLMQFGCCTCNEARVSYRNLFQATFMHPWTVSQKQLGRISLPYTRLGFLAGGCYRLWRSGTCQPPGSSTSGSRRTRDYLGHPWQPCCTLIATGCPVFLSLPFFTTAKPAATADYHVAAQVSIHARSLVKQAQRAPGHTSYTDRRANFVAI